MCPQYRQVGLSLDGETIQLHKFHGKFAPSFYASAEWRDENRALLKRAIALDVETTGLSHTHDEVIEIALRPFTYRTDTGEILNVDDGYSSLQEPKNPLSPVIQKVTGLTDDALRGHRIDWSIVAEMLGDAEVIIAHNAAFDRPFIDAAVHVSRSKVWSCSLNQIDWKAKGYPSQKLEILNLCHGFFVDAHRAMNDVNALIYLLNCPDAETGHRYLRELLELCFHSQTVISAEGAPFATKDALKERGYRWNAEKRCWSIRVHEASVEEEKAWLEESVYAGPFRGTARLIPCEQNFSQASRDA